MLRLQGHGDGSFTDKTAEAGLLFPATWHSQKGQFNLNSLRHLSSHSATWADYDRKMVVLSRLVALSGSLTPSA